MPEIVHPLAVGGSQFWIVADQVTLPELSQDPARNVPAHAAAEPSQRLLPTGAKLAYVKENAYGGIYAYDLVSGRIVKELFILVRRVGHGQARRSSCRTGWAWP